MDSNPSSVNTLLYVSGPEARIVRKKSDTKELNSANGCENKTEKDF